MALRPNEGYGLIHEVSRSRTAMHHSRYDYLDEWSAGRSDLYLTTHNIHKRRTSVPQAGFEPKISAGERPQTYALGTAAIGIGIKFTYNCKMWNLYTHI